MAMAVPILMAQEPDTRTTPEQPAPEQEVVVPDEPQDRGATAGTIRTH